MAKSLIQATRQQDKVLTPCSDCTTAIDCPRFVVVAESLIPPAAFLQTTRASPKLRKKFDTTTEVRRSSRAKTTPVSYKDDVSYLPASI